MTVLNRPISVYCAITFPDRSFPSQPSLSTDIVPFPEQSRSHFLSCVITPTLPDRPKKDLQFTLPPPPSFTPKTNFPTPYRPQIKSYEETLIPASDRMSESCCCSSSYLPRKEEFLPTNHSTAPLTCAFPNTPTLMTTLRYMANTKIAIANILASPSPAIHLPEFQFTGTTGAANHNWSILERYNLDLHQVLLSQVLGSTLRTFGSEFRSIDLLRSFIQDHPLWPRFCCWLAHGVQFPLQPLPKIQHTQDLALMVARANHA